MAGIAVCLVLVIDCGVAVAALLYSGRLIPRHAFIFDMVAKLAASAVDRESVQQPRMLTAV